MGKTMHLTSKQLFLLFVPFITAALVYNLSDYILKNSASLFPKHNEYSNSELERKTYTYLQIEAKNTNYKEIKKKFYARKTNAQWISNVIFLKNAPAEVSEKVINKKIQTKKQTQTIWNLEAVFSKEKVAIINGKFVSKADTVDGATLLKIENNRVLLELQHKKGKKWIYLFH